MKDEGIIPAAIPEADATAEDAEPVEGDVPPAELEQGGNLNFENLEAPEGIEGAPDGSNTASQFVFRGGDGK